jgi:hypothetical protein
MIEPKMGADLKKGWIGSRSGPARGRAVSNVPPPTHLCLPYCPAESGAAYCVVLDGREVSTGGPMRFLSAENERAERFRPILDELVALPADAAAATLDGRNVPSPRGGRWYAAQVIRMRKRLGAGPRRKPRKGLLEGWLEPHGAAPCPSSPHDGPGGHHVGHGCMQRLAVEPRSPAMLAPVSNSPGLGTIGGDHRKEVDVGWKD